MWHSQTDFVFDVRSSLAPKEHVWVGSGYGTLAPRWNILGSGAVGKEILSQ